MKNLKRLALRYKLLSSYLLSLVISYSTMIGVMMLFTCGKLFTDPNLNLLLNAMTVTSLITSIICTFLCYPIVYSFKYDLIPDRAGVWEWTDDYGIKILVEVCDVSIKKDNSYLRVYWCGGYYNIKSELEPLYKCDGSIARYELSRNEWKDGIWGERVGDNGSIDESKLFLTIDKH